MSDNKINLTKVKLCDFEEILYHQNNDQPIERSNILEEGVSLYLYYNSDGKHFGTYNRGTRNAWHFDN